MDQAVSPKDLAEAGAEVRSDLTPKSIRAWLSHGVGARSLAPWLPEGFADDELGVELTEDAAYAPYLARQEAELRDLKASEALRLPDGFDFGSVPGLSNEMAERLSRARPDSLASAGRVPGVTPAALSALLVQARRAAA